MKSTTDIVTVARMAALNKVCLGIATGLSVKKSCAEAGIHHDTFYQHLMNDKDLAELYGRAREARADARFESMQELLDETKAGEVDPITARVLLDAMKWQCGKEKGRVYGDSTTIKGDKDNPLTLQALSSALDERVKARIESKKD